MSSDRIPRMANQIAAFMASRPEAEGISGVSSHINDFWSPPMRAKLLALAAAGGVGLHPLVTAAIPQIRQPPAS